jgi:hypothetical protein
MELISIIFAIIAACSEILPLLEFTKSNGILHGIKEFVIHIDAKSECHVDVEKKTNDS